jgi:hypothetical protein
MKTLILWKRKRARTFKQWGTATADCSVLTIGNGWRKAARGEGTLAIVDAPTAEHARRLIAAVYQDRTVRTGAVDIGAPGIVGQHLDGRVITIGANAALALAGASEGARNWDKRIARDGRVRVADTRALGQRTDGAMFNVHDAFGHGFRS